jgi:hypothetical protein
MPNGLQIVSSRLLVPNMSVDARISRGPSQILSFSKRNVLPFRVLITLCQSEVYDEYTVLGMLRASDHEVIWLDVSVDDALFMDLLDPLYLKQN